MQHSFVWLRLDELIESGDIAHHPYKVTHADWAGYANLQTSQPGGPTALMYKNLTNGKPRGKHWLLPWTQYLRTHHFCEPWDRLSATIMSAGDPERVVLYVGLQSQLDSLLSGWQAPASFYTPPTSREVPALVMRALQRKFERGK